MTQETIKLIIDWFGHIQQMATDRKTCNGAVMDAQHCLDEIAVLASESKQFVEAYQYEQEHIEEEELNKIEHNTPNKIYVYDRLNRRIQECEITEIKGNWAYYNFNGKECTYWLGGSVVAPENVSGKPFKPCDYKFLVSIDRKSLWEIKDSDVTIFSIINNSLRNKCEELLLGPKR